MKKLLPLVLLALSGCVFTPVPEYPVGYTTALVAPTCCVIYQGYYGFWYGGAFIEGRYWHPDYHGGGPIRFAHPGHGGHRHR